MTSRPEARGQRPEPLTRARRPGPHDLLVAALLIPLAASAQGPLPPATGTPGVAGEIRTVSGRVMRGSADSPQPVTSQMVVLHRISTDSSGPVDSVRTTANGAYRFRYKLEGPRSMYIVSTRYSGVAYFTAPLRDRAVTSPDGDVTVYDTSSAGFPLTVRARHIVIAPADPGGVRRVVDVYEVANDSNRTLVAGATGSTWRVKLPDGAREPSSTGGDLPAEAFRFTEGQADLLVPFPPGERQVVLTYGIPAGSPVTLPVAAATSTLEVLVEGTGATVRGAGLSAEDTVSLEGRTFQRFTASPVAAGASFVVAGSSGWSGRAGRLALVAVAAIAVALGIVIGRRGAGGPAAAGPPPPASEALAREIAALDHVYAEPARQAGAGGEHYRSRRAALIGQLVEAQAVEDRETTT